MPNTASPFFALRPATPADLPFWKQLHGLTMREYVETLWG